MYIPPEAYKCPECQANFKWSIHHDSIGLQQPFCPDCYEKFITTNVPLGVYQDKELCK